MKFDIHLLYMAQVQAVLFFNLNDNTHKNYYYSLMTLNEVLR